MTPKSYEAQPLEAFLARGGSLQTRLRERSVGEVHDFPSLPPAIPGMSLDPEAVVAALEGLEAQGVVVSEEKVNPYDSSEYTVTWKPAGRASPAS